jgi:hypothetical protein
MSNSATIVWSAIYLKGHEYCRVHSHNGRWYLTGVAVFLKDKNPCRLEYVIECDSAWHSRAAKIAGRVGDEQINVEITVQSDQSWRLNGVEQPAVSGCIDIDLNFSPSTNLLPVRRLKLTVGQQATVNAGWVRFPGFKLERLEQTYTRLDELTYRYKSGGGAFVRELRVNDFGLVTSYPGIWEEEPG